MQFNAEQYYQASLERMKQAKKLYEIGTAYALAMYCGGLAVESLLRAFRWKHDPSFEGRHDLSDLLQASRLMRFDAEFMNRGGFTHDEIDDSSRQLKSAMNQIIPLWHNNLRFASEAKLKAFLNETGKLKAVKGDPLKKNALDLINAAQSVVDRGIVLWTSKIKS
jgi:hypothetical protein